MNDKLKDILPKLLQQAPKTYKALTTPYDRPGEWSDGELPLDEMFGHDDELVEFTNRGLDPNLLTEPSGLLGVDDNDNAIWNLRNAVSSPANKFPSDNLQPYHLENITLDKYRDDYDLFPAHQGALTFLNTDPSDVINRDELLDLGGDLGGWFDDLGTAMENDSDLRTLYSYLSKKKYGA